MSTIQYSTDTKKLKWLVEQISTNAIIIPPHQRDYVWSKKQKVKLIESVQARMPISAITLRERQSGQSFTRSLEDGQQRLRTLAHYRNNQFANKAGILFKDLSPVDQLAFDTYDVIVTTYTGATDTEAIVIFGNLQNGTNMTVGEKIHSMTKISPFTQFVVNTLLTPGMGLYDRALPLWGGHSTKEKRGASMASAFAVCAGLAYGTEYISKKWEDIDDVIAKTDFDANEIVRKLELIISIFEFVHAAGPITAKERALFWDPSSFVGYIVHSLTRTAENETVYVVPDEAETVRIWSNFINRSRQNSDLLTGKAGLWADVTQERTWKPARWRHGWCRVFVPDWAGPDVRAVTDSEPDDTDE